MGSKCCTPKQLNNGNLNTEPFPTEHHKLDTARESLISPTKESPNTLKETEEDQAQNYKDSTHPNQDGLQTAAQIQETQKDEENLPAYTEKPIQVKAQANARVPYWNEYPGHILDLQYDLSEEKSIEMFNLLNSIKMSPGDYIEEARKNNVEHLIQAAAKSPLTQTSFISSEGYYYVIRDLLATPSDPSDLAYGIKNHFEEKKWNVDVFVSRSGISDIKGAVWNMLINSQNMDKGVLTMPSEYCVVCSLAIPDTDEANSYFVMMRKNSNE